MSEDPGSERSGTRGANSGDVGSGTVGPPPGADRARIAGPAGTSAIELPDGTVLEFDHIDPTFPIHIEIAGDGPAGPLLLDEMLGSGQWRGTIGRMIVLGDLVSDPRLHPLARIAAAVEFIVAVDRTPWGDFLRPALPDMVRRVRDLVDEIDDQDITDLTPELATRLSSSCERAADATDRFDSVFHDLGRHLDPTDLDDAAADMELSMPALNSAVPDLRSRVLHDVDRVALDDGSATNEASDYLDIRRIMPTLLRVTVARQNHRRWVRVLRRDGLVLLAQAPLSPDDLVDVAELLIPPDVDDTDLEVQVVEIPDRATSAGRPIESIREAVEVGRDAARSARLHDLTKSAVLWRRCGELWRQAGDDERAALAHSLANRPVPTSLVRPYLADEVADELPYRAL